MRCTVGDDRLGSPTSPLGGRSGLQFLDSSSSVHLCIDVLATEGVARKDAVGAYLALPAHLRYRPIPSGGRTPADGLVCQLRLLDDHVSITSERVFSSHTRDIADLSEYLERRNRQAPPELESGP
jgi:hypothetical protein